MMRGIGSATQRLRGDNSGVSAIEFAFIFPILLLLCLGCIAVVNGVRLQRKVTTIAATMANLVTQNTTVTSANMTTYFGASSLILAPYPTSPIVIVVSCVAIDANGNATVSWSSTLNGTARGVGSSVTLPSALVVKSTSVVMSEVSYLYTPTLGTGVMGPVTLSKTIYMSPRLSATISYTS
jgi:Flp pilus assembly protein TadG